MAGIILDVNDDIQKLQKLKAEIENVKKALKSINVKVDIDIAKGMEAQLQSLMGQYDALVKKVSEAEGKIMISTKRINDASDKIIKAQEQLSKATGVNPQAGNGDCSTAANNAETASVQAQAKAYDELANEIDSIMGTRMQNIKRMIEEQNAIRLINEEIKKLTKYQTGNSSLTTAQQNRLEQLNNSLLAHKVALSEVRQTLMNNVKMDNAAATSMNGLSQSLSRMRITYRELTEEERNSPFGKELLASIQQADAKIKELDASIGNHQRNVGNYASGFNGLNMSVQQIVRELPSAAMGLNTFFLAISNNLPILTDEIKRAKAANEELRASGQKGIPVWKQVATSLFSWQTALMVGISLLTVYGKEIGEWVKGLLGADAAQKRLNESFKEFNSIIIKEEVHARTLFDAVKKTNEGTKQRADVIRKINESYGKYLPNLLSEKASLLEFERAYKNVNKALIENAALKAQTNAIDKVIENSLETRSKALLAIQEGAGKKNEKAVTEVVMGWTEDYYKAGLKWYKAFNDISENIRKRFGKMPEGFYSALEDYVKSVYDSNKEIKKIQEKYNPFFNDKQANEAVVKNKEYWDKQRAAYIDALGKLSDEEAKGGKGKDLKKKISEIDKIIEYSYSPINKPINKPINNLKDYLNEVLQLRRDNEDREVESIQDGTERQLAAINLRYDREIEAVNKLRDELKKAQGGKLTTEQTGIFDSALTGIEAGRARDTESVNNLHKTLIEKYQSYADQRLSIEKKFNDDIVLLQEARNRAEEKADTDEMARIDRSIAKATADKGKELMKHDLDVMRQSPEYIRAFEDLKNTSSETLNSLLSQFENAKQAAAKVLNPEDLREYTSTIQSIMDELDSRNPFRALADKQKELAEAEKELADAKRQLDAVNNGRKVVTGIRAGEDGKIESVYLSATDALNRYNAAKDKHRRANNNFIKAENTAKEKVDELADAIRGIGDAIGGQAGEIISLIGDVSLFATSMIDGISRVSQTGANAISAVEKASVILGIISTAIQLLQKISNLGNNKAFKQYEAYAEKIKEINALTDAVNEYRIAALEAQQVESNWFSTDNLKNLRHYKELHDEVSKAYAEKAMESQAIYQNKSGGGWLTGALNWAMGNLSALAWWDKWRNIWGQGGYDKGMTAAVNNLRIETRKASKGFLGTGIGGKSQKTEDLVTWAKNQGLGDLFDDKGLINKELAQSLIENYGDKLVGQTKDTLEALIELREQYDEYIEKLHEYVSSLYQPLVDNMLDSLWDWFDEGKSALDSFKDYASDTFREIVSDMLRTIVLEKVVGTFSDDISALYEKYAEGAINEAELMKLVAERTEGLVGDFDKNIPTLQNIMDTVNGYLMGAGIDLKQQNSSSQSASGRGFGTEMTHEDAGELKGRFTALYESNLRIEDAVRSLSITDLKGSLTSLSSSFDTIYGIADETRTILANSYLELQQISENTEDSAKYLKDIKADIAEVKRNTSRL